MKDTVKTLMLVVGVGFTLITIAWLVMLAILIVTWFGGII